MKLKSAPARFKAADGTAGGGGLGEFEAIVSVFGNVDSWGDVVKAGAFTDSIAEWKAGPNILPVLWSHRMDDPTYNIGEVIDLAEFEPGADLPDWVDPWVKEHGGLWVKGRIDTGTDASPIAVHALRLLKTRRVTQFSYAYDEIDSGAVEVNGTEVWELRKLKLYEVSPTQIGANELTDLLAAKAGTMARRKLTLTADERDSLRGAIDQLGAALDDATVEGAADDGTDEATTDNEPTADDAAGPDGAPKRRATARKAGRTLSAKNEGNIKEAVRLLSETLKSLDREDDDEKAKREEPDGAKREELPRTSPASVRLLHDLALAECTV